MLPDISSKQITQEQTFYGIDLGTSYTLVAKIDTSALEAGYVRAPLPVRLVKIKQLSPSPYQPVAEHEKVASIYAIDSNQKEYVGNHLLPYRAGDEFQKDKNIFYHWKLDLGIDQNPLYPSSVKASVQNPSQVAGKVLNYLRFRIFQGKSHPLPNTVITVPASFQTNQRKDVIEAMQYAQIEQNDGVLADEPNAALVGYLNQSTAGGGHIWERAKEQRQTILVFDMGGGTCDLSIVGLKADKKEGMMLTNHAISRYNNLGGQDIDMMIAEEHLWPAYQDHFNASFPDYPLLFQLASIGEKLKIDICDQVAARQGGQQVTDHSIEDLKGQVQNATINKDNNPINLPQVTLEAEQLKALTKKLFTKAPYRFTYMDKQLSSISSSVNDITNKADMALSDIDAVLLAGGSSRNPFVVQELSKFLPNAEIWQPEDPDGLIAKGAAVMSFFKFGVNYPLIKPITSETIGVITKGRAFYTLIDAGTQVPVDEDIPAFTIQHDFQKQIEIPFCVRDAANEIGRLFIPLEEMYPQDARVSINVRYDIDKTMHITVKIDQQEVKNATFENPFSFYGHSPEHQALSDRRRNLEEAQRQQDKSQYKRNLKKIVWDYYNVENYRAAADAAREYLDKYDAEDIDVMNMLSISLKNLGQYNEARSIMEQAIDLEPDNTVLIYNYAIQIEAEEGACEAVAFINKRPEMLNQNNQLKAYLAIQKKHCGEPYEEEAREILEDYQNRPNLYDGKVGASLIEQIHRILGIPYSESAQKISRIRHYNDNELLAVAGDLKKETDV